MGKRKDRREKKSSKSKKRSKREESATNSGERDSSHESSEDEWVEKPTAPADYGIQKLPEAESQKRDDWMTGPSGKDDFSLIAGATSVKVKVKEAEKKAEEQRRLAIRAQRELNPDLRGEHDIREAASDAPAEKEKDYEFGDNGSRWRMMKLRRVFEVADEEGRPIHEVAQERFGVKSSQAFDRACEEKDFLDQRRDSRTSRNSRPGNDNNRYTPTVRRTAHFKSPESRDSETWQKPPIPPRIPESPSMSRTSDIAKSLAIGMGEGSAKSSVTQDDLNKLNARLLKAKLLGLPTVSQLEKDYALMEAQFQTTGGADNVVLTKIDSQGRLQDIGTASDSPRHDGPKRRKPTQPEADTHDKEGNRICYAAKGDDLSIQELILQEKMGTSNDFDASMAHQISSDNTFKSDLDYIDDNVDRLSRQKEKSSEQKRNIAVNDYKRHEKAVSKCPYCFHDGRKPAVPIIALGTEAYLALPENVDMVQGHCIIVPIEHHSTSLECNEDTWTEIRNFQKSLIRMFDAMGQSVLFMEQVINLKWHKHTVLECIPVPKDLHEDALAYFKEAMLSSESEWSQHRKVIDTSKHGFRRSFVKNMPYFHVWTDPNNGLGHLIEDPDAWPEYFGREVIASPLNLPPDRWRRPKRATAQLNAVRMKYFVAKWKDFDWTAALDGGNYSAEKAS
ncbi:CwfJ C-terminus 1-domain-containing protein-like protein [Phlyctochytrium arcticum]|nr:CwfJ C-terminus 1-domain-containing protein-like protein [Phlyctochytrium arcticum]